VADYRDKGVVALQTRLILDSAVERFGIQQVFDLKMKNGCLWAHPEGEC
jgi:hypothetical protein